MSSRRPVNRTRDAPGVFRAIAEFTYDWESWIDADGDLAWVNAAVERITGYSVAACLEMHDYPLPLIDEPDRARMAALFVRASRGESGNDVEFRVRRRDGDLRWCAVAWQPIFGAGGRALGYRTSVRDIQERKRAETQLVEAKLRAEVADRAKSEFLAVVSHELRSPLHSLMGYAELLAGTPLEPEQRRFLEAISRQNTALLRLVDDLLAVGALERSELTLVHEPFSPADLLTSVVEDARGPAEAKGLTIHLRIRDALPPRRLGDAQRLRQVLTNLVGNAIKFTARGRVTLSASGRAGALVIAVTDTGPGVSVADRPRIFEPFFQADSSLARKHGGSGLGLAIAARLTALMGGELKLETPRGGGSRFVLRFPIEEARAPRRRPRVDTAVPPAKRPVPDAPRRPGAGRRLAILLVDDDPLTLDVSARFVRALGHVATTASSGREGLARARRGGFDLIFLDLHMPDLNGGEVAKALRREFGAACPPLVAVTANVFTDRLPERALFQRVLHKPFTNAALEAAIREPLVDARAADDLAALGVSMKEWLARFRRDARRQLRKIDRALDRARAEEASEEAHRLRGLALTFGARALAEAAGEVERVARASRIPAAKKVARGLGPLLEETLEVLDHRDRVRPPAPEASSRRH